MHWCELRGSQTLPVSALQWPWPAGASAGGALHIAETHPMPVLLAFGALGARQVIVTHAVTIVVSVVIVTITSYIAALSLTSVST